jgi:membrane protease subunit (stomatin/prohibitin family)
MAEMTYSVDYYIHVETREAAVQLVQHMPYRGHALTSVDVNSYAAPVIEQAVNQLVQITPLERVNEKIHDLSQVVFQHLQQFLSIYGIALDTVKVLVFPRDDRMKALISLKAFGLSELDAVRYYTAMLLAENGVVSAPNMALGVPFTINGVQPTASTDQYTLNTQQRVAPPASVPQPPRPPQQTR